MPRLKVIGVIALLVICLTCSYFVNEGFHHILPQGMFRYARQNWTDGQYTKSVQWFVNANVSAFNAGMRWTIAKYYLQRVKDLLDRGKLTEALDNCSQAVKILNGHDDEGAVSYNCTMIEEKIKQQG